MARQKTMKVCTECGESKKIHEDFHNSRSVFHKEDGKFSACKNCVVSIIGEDKEKFIEWLAAINTPLIQSVYESTGLDVPQYYKRMSGNKQYMNYTFKDSDSVVTVEIKETELDDEAKLYSKKWLGTYKKSEIDYLENYLEGLHKDFRITNTNHKDYAMKIAKASLYLDKCYEEMMNNSNSNSDKKYQQAKGVFDDLSKSAKFSESGRNGSDAGIGSFSRVSELVENKKYVYKHEPLEKDTYDQLLDNMQHLFKSI